MAIARDPRYLAAALGAGLALGLCETAPAQPPSGPGISSGSGAGTGTGGAPQPTTPGADAGPLPAPGALGPLETFRDPEAGRPIYGVDLTDEQFEALDARLLNEARSITDPEELALALVRVARSKVFGRNYDAAHTALVEAGQAALRVPPGLVRDLRLMAVVTGLLNLAETRSSEGSSENLFTGSDEPLPPEAVDTWTEALKGAQEEWGLAADMAAQIGRRPYRSQTLFQVVESQSNDLSRRGTFIDRAEFQVREKLKELDPAKVKAARELVDTGLVQGAAHARRIDLPLWSDRALATLVSGAAGARQFDRGLQIALSIPRPDARADALLRLAEAQARHGAPEGATRSYSAALEAVASIPVTDLRIILASVLIDSLITSRRFEDARAAIVLFPDPRRRLDALGSIAYAQGRRGLSESAKDWIAQETSPEVRSRLYRRLNDGVLASLEQYLTKKYSVDAGR